MRINFSLFEIIIVGSIINGIHSLSYLNNVSVSSDVLSQIFYDEVNCNPNRVYESGSDFGNYNSEKCLHSLREIIKRYPSPQVARFFDAWGHIPAGVFNGNKYDFGNYDQCVKSSLFFNEFNGTFRVIKLQHCFVTLPLKQDPSEGNSKDFWYVSPSINVGVCVPDSCSPDLLTAIFKESTKTIFDGSFSEISVERCSDGQIPTLTVTIIAGISVLVILTVLMILSSVYDNYVSHYQKKPNPVLLSFSILTNGKRLFEINTKRSRSSIDCLTGMRVISTFWIILFHIHSNFLSGAPVMNYTDLYDWYYSWNFMLVYNGSMYVDTFFFIGGLLVAWVGFKELDKTNGKINVLMNIVHRYIRLTPILVAGLVLAYSTNKIIYTGPFRDFFVTKNNCNDHSWWPILLYIHNYFRDPSIKNSKNSNNCYGESWYLAVDFQLYALSPLILIPMWKWGKKFGPILVVLVLISIGWTIGVYFSEHYTGLVFNANPHEWEKVYTLTHTRMSPWIIGFGFGYFMHKNRQSEFQLSKMVLIIGWVVSIFTMAAILFGTYFSLNANRKGTVFEAAMYESLKHPAWALAQVWITFACHYGYGGVVDAFLSHPFWQPLGRLSYAIYMTHLPIVRMHYGMTRTVINFSIYNEFLYFWKAFGTALFIAIYVTFAFESPVLALEKIIFSRQKPVKKENDVHQELSPNIIIESQEKDL